MAAYTYRCAYSIGVPAEVAGHEIERVEQKYGEVTAVNLLDESRPEDAPLHKCYEWDDSVAAEQYRLFQSRKILSAVHVVILNDDGAKVETRMMANVTENRTGEGRYINMVAALAHVDSRAIVLNRAREEMKTFKDKYQNLSELSKVMQAIDDTLKEEIE